MVLNYHIEQQRLRRACASGQTRQSLCCSYTQGMDVDEDSDKFRPLARWLCQYGRLLMTFMHNAISKNSVMYQIIISCLGP